MTQFSTIKKKNSSDNPGTTYCSRAGFSLVEVIVVLAVLSILMAIGIPGFINWLPKYHLKSAARELYSNMQKARIEAIKRNKDWAIVFDAGSDKYFLCSDSGLDDTWSGSGLADNTIETTVNLKNYKSGVQYGHGDANSSAIGSAAFPVDDISFSNNVATFHPDGTGGSLYNRYYVYIENSANNTYAVGWLGSGVIKLQIWNGSDWK